MTRDLRLYLGDILDSIAKIEEYTQSIDEAAFQKNTQVQDAVLRRLEVIGEAAKKVPHEFREKHDRIPWRNMAGLRDVLIHEYFGVNLKRAWKVVREELPALKPRLLEARKDLDTGTLWKE